MSNIRASSDLLEGTPEEIEKKCIDFMREGGWQLLGFQINHTFQCVGFWAKTDMFGKDHYLNEKGFYFYPVISCKSIQHIQIYIKMDMICRQWGGKFGAIEFSGTPAITTMIIKDYKSVLQAELTEDILDESGYDLLKKAFAEDAKAKGIELKGGNHDFR